MQAYIRLSMRITKLTDQKNYIALNLKHYNQDHIHKH